MSTHVDVPALPEAGHPEVALMLAQLDEGTKEWLGELPEDLTEAEIVWQPFENGHSIGALMVHIAEVEAFWLHHVACGEPYEDFEGKALDGEEIDQYGLRWPAPPHGRPLSYYTTLLERVRTQTKELVGSLGDPERVSTREDGRRFTLRWLLTHVIGHESYHGGQAVLLLILKRKTAK